MSWALLLSLCLISYTGQTDAFCSNNCADKDDAPKQDLTPTPKPTRRPTPQPTPSPTLPDAHRIVVPAVGQNLDPECAEDAATTSIAYNSAGENHIAVQCCLQDGSAGYRQDLTGGEDYGSFTGCLREVPFAAASAACESNGDRLCTAQEVIDYVGYGTGCNFNRAFLWTSSTCALFTKHEGQQCMGTFDLLTGFEGTSDECKDKCVELDGCVGFIRVNSGTNAGQCFLRGGVLGSPESYGSDDRDCYEPTSTMPFDGIWPLTTGYCNTQSFAIGDAVNIEFDLHSLTWDTGESTVFIHFFDIGDDADALVFSMRYNGPLKALYFKYMKADGSHTSIQALGRTFESPADDDVTVHHELIVTQSRFIWKMNGVLIVYTDKDPHATGIYGACFPFLTNGASQASTDTAIMSGFVVYEQPTVLFVKHEGQQCTGTFDLLRGFEGTSDECKDKCVELDGCVGFIRVNSGTNAGQCFLRGGALGSPESYSYDDRDCYVPTSTMSFDGIWPLTTGYCNTQSVEIGDAVNIEFDLHSLTWDTGESTVFIHFFDIGDDADALAFSMRYSGPLKALYFKYMKADGSHTSIQALGRTFESPADDDVTVHHEIIVTQSHFIWKMDGIAVVDTDKVPHATGTYGAYFPFLTNGASRASTDTAIMSDFAVYEPLSAHKGTEKRDAFYPNNKNIPSVFEPK
eukprot:399539_1